MLKQSDVQGRLRLFRYGLVVMVVVAFLISLLVFVVARQALVNNLTPELAANVPGVEVFLGTVILITVVVAIVAVVAYFIYHYSLTRTLPFGLLGKGSSEE